MKFTVSVMKQFVQETLKKDKKLFVFGANVQLAKSKAIFLPFECYQGLIEEYVSEWQRIDSTETIKEILEFDLYMKQCLAEKNSKF